MEQREMGADTHPRSNAIQMRRIFLWGLALLVVVAVVVGVVYKRNSGPEGRTEAATATWHPNKTAFCAAWNNAPDHSFTKKALSAAQSLALYEYLAVNAPNKMAYTAYRTAALAFVPLMSDPVGLAYEQNGTLGYIGVARGEKVDATTTAFIHAMKAVLNQGNEGC